MNYKKKTKSKLCVICNNDFEADIHAHDRVFTCSKKCSKLRLIKVKMTGIYIQCYMCNKAIYRTHRKLKDKNFCSVECNNKFRREIGNINENKKQRKKYYGSNWNVISTKIRENQNHICKDCGISETEYKKKLSVHHIIPFTTFDTIEEANKISNLVGICEPCHRKRHTGDNHASKFKHFGKNNLSDYGVKTKRDKEKAIEIINLLLKTNNTLTEISQKVGVSYSTVSRIYNGKRWTELYEGDSPKITNKR